MSDRGPARVFSALLTVGALFGYALPAAAAEVRPFKPRFAERVTGDISIVTATSSTATASRPAGSRLLFAGLYWGGPFTPALPHEVTLQVGSRAPTTVVADVVASDPTSGFGAVADVTAHFRGAGPFVDLTVGNAGVAPWSLVTAWNSPREPLRDLRVIDGLERATAVDPATVTINGLSTPRRGSVDVTTGVVAHRGEARADADVDSGDTAATVPVRPDSGGETLVAAVTTATEAAAITDLGVSTVVVPDSAASGDVVEIIVKVINGGPDDQTGPATLTVEPGDGLTPDAVSLTVTDGACGLSGSQAVCAVDPLSAGRAAEVTFAAKVDDDAGSTLTPSARALAPTSDTDPVDQNDTAQASLQLDAQEPGPEPEADFGIRTPAQRIPAGDLAPDAPGP
jgi:hypothetical protein